MTRILLLLHMLLGTAILPQLSAEIYENPQKALEFLRTEGVKEIVFAKRTQFSDPHWYANFGYYTEGPDHSLSGRGGGLYKLDVKTGKVMTLVEDLDGAIRDPQVHYKAKKILFSYRKSGSKQFHLYEILTDGSKMRQLTDGLYDDFEPSYLPNGEIAFVSSRAKRWVPCWSSQVATLHKLSKDRKTITTISANVEQDNTPSVLPDGRLLFTRWEYVDRSQMDFHHLWVMNPDGTNVQAFFGNMHPGGVFIDAKPIEGTQEVVYIDSPGHGLREHAGALKILNPQNGPDDKSSARTILPQSQYRDPFPVSKKCFLIATPKGIGVTHLEKSPGDVFLLMSDSQSLRFHEPSVIRPRKREPLIASRVNPKKRTGTLVLGNAYKGRKMNGIKDGEIKKLMIMEVLPKPVTYGSEQTHDFVPVSWGGTHFLERILGTVPVEADGSAHFEVPADRPFFFVSLDEKNRSIKRMHSFMSVRPGETISCLGCHGTGNDAPKNTRKRLQALRRPPSKIKKLKYNRFVYDFPRDIQPILDKNCVKCHNPKKPNGRILLHGDNGPAFSASYFTLISRRLIVDGRNGRGNSAPRAIGDSASRLMNLIDGSHFGVKLSEEETEHIRNWINVGGFYPGTYAALGQGMMIGKKKKESYYDAREKALNAMANRCDECHMDQLPMMEERQGMKFIGWNQPQKTKPWDVYYSVHSLYNLSRPEYSPILLAPLSKRQGGWAKKQDMKKIPRSDREITKDSACPEIFKSKKDPDYIAIRDFILEGKKHLEENKRWNMKGFKLPEPYTREMKKYGILPESFDPNEKTINFYKVDRKYWQSLWYYPEGAKKPKMYENTRTYDEIMGKD